MVQVRDKANYWALIVIAAEGREHRAEGLIIAASDVRFAPGVDRSSQFVADWSGDQLALGDNALAAGIVRFGRR